MSEDKLRDRVTTLEAMVSNQAQQSEKVVNQLQNVSADLREMIVALKEFTVKHDTLEQDNKEIKEELKISNEKIQKLIIWQAESRPVLNTVRSLGNRIYIFVLLTLLAPMAYLFQNFFKG